MKMQSHFLILWIHVDELFVFMSRSNLCETMKDCVATGFISCGEG